MLATTIQITNNPPHTPRHPNHKRSRPGMQATTTTSGGRSHGVEREPDSVLARITFYAQPTKRTHTHHPHQVAYTCRHKKTTQHNPTGHAELFPTKLGSLERR